MPNTIKPTTVPQEGPLAVVHEVDDVLALVDTTVDPLTAGLPAEILDDGEILAAQLLAKRVAYATSLSLFHTLGSNEAKVDQKAMAIVRRDSAASISSSDPLETPPLDSPLYV